MRRILILTLAICFVCLGCSDPESSSDNNNADPDAGADAATDVDAGPVDTGPTSCALQRDCDLGTFCHDGTCVEAPECSTSQDWATCVEAFDDIEDGLGQRAVCDQGHCRVACVLDGHCQDGEICTDNGHCREFTGELTGEHPGGGARAPLQAGVSNTLMNFPIGLSQGGYGSRNATNAGRYVESLNKTDGQMHGMFARAFVLDNGERQLMFIRLPIIFPSFALHEAVARRLQEQTGRDWRDSLIISATHTHSGPTRYWQLPKDSLLPLGTFGTDEFSQQVFDWTVESTVEAAEAALADLSPAQFGWEIVEAYDTDDLIASDRWGETPAFDDNRLLIFRIDDDQGQPRAVMVSYGTHGTVHSKNYFTGDVLTGAERVLEARLGQAYDRFVPVMYMSQNGGSMSPRGDRWGHRETERFEAIGHMFAERTLDTIEAMETSDDLDMAASTHRFPISYELVGYERGEWTVGPLGEGSSSDQMDFGALQCLGGSGDDDHSTYNEPPIKSGCMPIHLLVHHKPPTLFTRSQMTALQLGELTMLTMPGELSMELGWQVLREARDRHGVDPMKAWTFGYAQDHQFYLTPTNLRGELPPFPGISTPQAPDDYPDYAFSWLQGGYEASLSIWGWKFGDFLVERSMETLEKLVEGQVDGALPEALPSEFTQIEHSPFPVDPTDASRAGAVVEQPPTEVARLTPIEFAWVGGDPGAEMPQAPRVSLERSTTAGFEPIELASKRPYDNREPLMLTRVRPNDDDDEWHWVVRWEELHDFPAGDYRFRVEGHYLDGDDRTAYETTSDTFELIPTDAIVVEVESDGATISGTLGYPAAEPLEYSPTPGEDDGRVTGNFRMRHPRVSAGRSAPLEAGDDVTADDITVRVLDGATEVATYTGADLTLATAEETVGGRDGVPVTRWEADASGLSAGSYDVEVEVVDAYGNEGVGSGALVVD